MGCPIGQNSLFGTGNNNYIKFQGGDLIAVEGANTVDRQILSDIRFPFKQILRGRVVLKAGQINYLLNHLGLGDNATFVSIAARYDSLSKIEEDNYVQYSYYPDLSKVFYFAQMLLLTGNSTHRVPQLYLTNPNANYPVILDIMVAVLDDTYNYFNNVVNQSGLSFTGLAYTDIETYVPDHSLVVLDIYRNPLVYISIQSITSITKMGLIVIIQEVTLGKIFLEFINQYNANQAYSMFNFVWKNVGLIPPVIANQSNVYVDNTAPVVYFNLTVGATASGATISMTGSTQSGPYDTSMGLTFSTEISLSQFGGSYSTFVPTSASSNIGVPLSILLFDRVEDAKDGVMTIDNSNLILKDSSNITINSITSTGTYSMTFNISDYVENYIDTTTIILNIKS